MKRLRTGKAAWHVYARGARRLLLYRDEQDFLQFLCILAYALRMTGAVLWAYALMSNHYHLVVHATSSQLEACMHRANHLYSLYHNKKYRLGGHTFDGPYGSARLGWIGAVLRTIAYVFANPVVAGMVKRPEDYRWTSYRSFLGRSKDRVPVDARAAFSFLGAKPERARRLFAHALKHELSRQKSLRPGVPTAVEVQADHFAWLRSLAEGTTGRLKRENPEAVSLYWAHEAGIPPRAIAKALGEPTSRRIRRVWEVFEAQVARDPELREALSLAGMVKK